MTTHPQPLDTLSSQRAAATEYRPPQAGNYGSLLFYFHPLRRKFMPECLISGDLRNSFFKVVRSSSESRLYLSWNALQNSSVNCCTLSPGDCMAFWTSRISSSAGVVSGALSLSLSWALRMSCRMASHVLCVTWQKNLPLVSVRLPRFSDSGLRRLRDGLPIS